MLCIQLPAFKKPSPLEIDKDFLFFTTCKASKVHSEVSKLGTNRR